jgi:phage host-nuclease inhibitor protein Gam
MTATARIKPADFATRADYDDAVNGVCDILRERKALAADAEKEIADIRLSLAQLDEPLKLRQDVLTARCAAYATAHRDSLLGKLKSVVVALGKWGFRLQKKISRPDDLIDRIRAAGRTDLLVVKESVNLAAVNALPDSEQASFGIAVTAFDEYFIEPKKESPAPAK